MKREWRVDEAKLRGQNRLICSQCEASIGLLYGGLAVFCGGCNKLVPLRDPRVLLALMLGFFNDRELLLCQMKKALGCEPLNLCGSSFRETLVIHFNGEECGFSNRGIAIDNNGHVSCQGCGPANKVAILGQTGLDLVCPKCGSLMRLYDPQVIMAAMLPLFGLDKPGLLMLAHQIFGNRFV